MNPECDVGDYNYDGHIDGEDVNILISNFGTMCSPELMEKTTTNIIEHKDTYIQETKIFDLFGREINDKARLTPGIYLVMETWSDGQIKIRKIFLNQLKKLLTLLLLIPFALSAQNYCDVELIDFDWIDETVTFTVLADSCYTSNPSYDPNNPSIITAQIYLWDPFTNFGILAPCLGYTPSRVWN